MGRVFPMNLVQVRITRTVATTRYGTLVSKDLLRTDAAFARFLVEDVAAAEYLIQPEQPAAPARKPRKRKEQPQ